MNGDGSSAGSSAIRTALPKTVHLDDVTAGNILDRLRLLRDDLRSPASVGYVSPDHPELVELDADLAALADAITVARIEARARSMRGVLR